MTSDNDKNTQILHALMELNEIGKETNRQLVESRHETSRLIDTMMNHDKNVERATLDVVGAVNQGFKSTAIEHKEISRDVGVSIEKNGKVIMYGTVIMAVVGALAMILRLNGMI